MADLNPKDAGNKVVHGARAVVQIDNKIVGIFNNVSVQLGYETQPVYILGRYSPAEIDYTAQDPVTLSCQGFRTLNHGPHTDAGVPLLQDLLTAQDVTISVHDRKSGLTLMTVVGCRATGWSSGVAARQLEDLSVNYVGLRVMDEDHADVNEAAGATDLP